MMALAIAEHATKSSSGTMFVVLLLLLLVSRLFPGTKKDKK